MMKSLTCVLAILAAASTAALAKDLKQDKKSTAPTATATPMTDAEMDKVTAGDAPTMGGPYYVSVGASGNMQQVGGPFNGRFSNTGYYNGNGGGALFLVPP